MMVDDQPIFIVGAPRSGTTLLRTLLNRHPRIGLCDETYYFYYVYERASAFGDLSLEKNRAYLIDQYLQTQRMKRLALPEEDLKNAWTANATDYASFFAELCKCYAQHVGKERWGEKTPDHALHVDTLLKWYPQCRILHIVRDPRDVVASLLRMPWGGRSVLANARRWAQCNEAAIRLQDHPRCHIVHYERMIDDPELELSSICEFVGESFSSDMLVPEENANVHKWWFERAQGEVTKDRLEKWRQELTAKQVAITEWVTHDYMEQFGYDVSAPSPGGADIAAAHFSQWCDGLRRRLSRMPQLWYHWVQPTKIAAEESWIDRGT